jgi:hypothetical protein
VADLADGARHRTVAVSTWALFAGILGVTMIMRLALAFEYAEANYDHQSLRIVGDALRDSPLHVYELVPTVRWPYPPGFLPWVWIASVAGDAGLSRMVVVMLPAIIADIALALLVFSEMVRTGSSTRTALMAGSIVALAPTFILNSAHHGQIDSVAILPAVAAIVTWRRAPIEKRALWAGLLLGVAISIKTPAGLPLLALLPLCAARREALILAGSAASVVGVLLAPFFLATPRAVVDALTHGDVPGVGGLRYVVLIDLKAQGLAETLHDFSMPIVVLVSLCLLAVLWRRRPVEAAAAAGLLWLGFFALAPSFFWGYLIWGIPFFLLAGHVRATVALVAAAAVPTVLYETERRDLTELYQVFATAIWIGFVVALVLSLRSLYASRRQPPERERRRLAPV